MEGLLGLLRVHVHRGVNLAIRDMRSSDPYVVIKMGKQKLKTRVVKKNLNPLWNDDLTLSITEPILPVKLAVYDKDTFSRDDKMGDVELDIGPILEAVKMDLHDLPSGTIITKIQANRQNCFAEESCIMWMDNQVVQNMFLRLRNVECGEVEVQLQWIKINGSKGDKGSLPYIK
ncbi:protein C2-DOMAIN ABA-RELATED 2-like [Malania oleifera]|uniref:protein C2-DOMAIN ABA-RELATED 2-like n=1 Tax=Malania oleifera TaxID=397392 RepID=UPI0025AEC539|nr:protein C2-DOMAIN ABA-RELATED 2-like [Malania oleifera]